MRLRPVGIDLLGGDELGGGRDQSSLLLRRQRQEIGSGQRPRRFDTDGANRVTEERSDCLNHCRRRRGRQGARRRHPDERAGIGERRLDRRLGGGCHIRRQQQQRARPRDGRLALVEDQPIELLFRVDGSNTPGMQGGAIMRGALPPVRIPRSDALGGPFGGPPGVALSAGVRGAERYRQVGPRNADAVIAPRPRPCRSSSAYDS